ncbi:hypothetical protein Pan216_19500 [Planctomycetes bacterium Pan216]|uniref:UDP-2,3-diacylglucosamine pyrophosphatase LpxI n=1 Tax=Kolteria novifilia TaxID=2527975 RepID=A0A518B2E1_9BACT|nr:hypothetical protein Pan216_19500 [Planctomycetes bacterium Pan216]
MLETKLADKPRFSDRVGLLAGAGRFPFHFADAAREQGIEVVCVGVRDHVDPALRDHVDRYYEVGLGKLGGAIRCFKGEAITWAVMAGKIHKVMMFSPMPLLRMLPDWRTIRWWLARKGSDNKDDTLLLSIIREFQKDGIEFASALEVCPELLADVGTFTRRQPTESQARDIAFGWTLAREMGRLDVGQSVVVKNAAAIAIEAIEGTDRAIARAGQLCRAGGFTVVKVAKPLQDMRFDVPTVGVQTIVGMAKAGGSVLAIEAHRTILIDREETIQLANRHGIAIVSLTGEEAAKTDPMVA